MEMDIRANRNITNNNNDPRIAPVFLCPESTGVIGGCFFMGEKK